MENETILLKDKEGKGSSPFRVKTMRAHKLTIVALFTKDLLLEIHILRTKSHDLTTSFSSCGHRV